MTAKHPIPDAALDDRLGFVGTAGSGKTYNASACVERLLDSGARVVVVDPLDVWWGLRLIANGSASSRYAMPIFGGARADLPITEHAGALVGETVAGMAESCIVSLGSFATKSAERRFMLAFLDAIYRKASGEPVHLIFDEADLWAPQKSSEPMLQSRMEEICRRGRIKGLIPWLITQRPAVISKDVLSQVDGLLAFKLTSSQDRDALEGWIEGQADRQQWKAIRAQLPTLQQGHGVIWLPGRGVLDTAAFPPKRTFDSSRTPKRGEKSRATTTLKPLDLGALKARLATVEAEVKANDPAALKTEIAKLKAELQKAERNIPQNIPAADPSAITAAEQRGYMSGLSLGKAKGEHTGFVAAAKLFDAAIEHVKSAQDRANNLIGDLHSAIDEASKSGSGSPAPPRWRDSPVRAAMSALPRAPSPAASDDGNLTNPQRALLRSLAWWRQVGHDEPSRPQVAAIVGWKPTGSNLKDRLSELSRLELVEYPHRGFVALQDWVK